MLLRLSPEERMVGIGAILVLISAFLPWYSVVFSFNEESITESGFTGDLGVVGFVIFLLTIMGLVFLIGEHLNFKLPKFGFKKENIILFLTGESAFLLLMIIAIYTKRSFEYTNAELRFGLYLALIGAFISTFATFAQIQKKQKKDVESFFSHSEEVEEETEKIEDKSINDEPAYKEQEYRQETKKEPEVTPPQAEQKSFFYEEPTPQPEVAEEDPGPESSSGDSGEEEPIEPEMIEEEPVTEETLEPETIEDETPPQEILAEEEIKEEIPTPEEVSSEETEELELESYEDTVEATEKLEEEVSLDSPSDQGDYFSREAGIENKPHIKVDMDSIRRVEKEPEAEPQEESEVKKSSGEGGGFYDDL